MRTVTMFGLAVALVLPVAAVAQPVRGIYVAAGAGGNVMQPELLSASLSPVTIGAVHIPATTARTSVDLQPGAVGVASLGYGFGNGWRVELEADGRYNALAHVPLAYESKIGGMANGYFDLDVGSPYIYPYIGAGAGAMDVHRNVSGTPNSGEFAYQGIFGTAFPVAPVVGLSVTLEYRFMGLAGANTTLATPPPLVAHVKFDRDYNHSALLGLRYAFNVVPPAPAAAAPPAAAPAPQAARSYLVFFDWDRADLSDRAKAIISTAAQNSTHVEYTSIAVNGYTDRSGSAAYNQRLSVRRAQAVAAELMRDGVPTKAISIQGFGESNPLVPTAKGVREPQNRRVEIIIQ